MKLDLIQVTVRRDANTITPITIPAHEATLVRKMFGKENVQGDEVVGTVDLDPEGEFERLSAKYGQKKVVDTYGDDNGERLAELVEKSASKPKAVTAKNAKADKGAGSE